MTTKKDQPPASPPFGLDRRVSVSARAVAMVAPFASREESRYYLNGVFVTAHPDGGVMVVATDGHRMAAVRDAEGATNGDWINPVPAEILRACKRKARHFSQTASLCHFVGATACVTNHEWGGAAADPAVLSPHHMATAAAPALDGIFPRFLDVFPKTMAKNAAPAQTAFNPTYIKAFTEVAAAAGLPRAATIICATGNKPEPALVFIEGVPEFVGLLMPMLHKEPKGIPAWLTAARKAKAQPAKAKPKAKPKPRARAAAKTRRAA